MNIQAFLNGFLDIVDYKNNKEEFIDRFFAVIYDRAIEESIKSLSEEKKNQASEEFKLITDPQALQGVIDKYFLQEAFDENLKNSTQAISQEYLQSIYSELSDEKKKQLSSYFSSFSPQP